MLILNHCYFKHENDALQQIALVQNNYRYTVEYNVFAGKEQLSKVEVIVRHFGVYEHALKFYEDMRNHLKAMYDLSEEDVYLEASEQKNVCLGVSEQKYVAQPLLAVNNKNNVV